jgi:glucose-1-phosphate cytidylyltransferase
MKTIILAGGLGTRLSEETDIKPKPMVEIGGKPMLWHIMKLYSHFGHTDFIVLLGYKGYLIKEYFVNYFYHQNNITVDLSTNKIEIHSNKSESWKITLLDTGDSSMTGSRVLKAQEFVKNETFMLTYGDGLSDVDLNQLVNFHRHHGKILTMTSVQPDGRFGSFESEKTNKVTRFLEKPRGDGSWINGGFFVCEPKIFNYISHDTNSILEQEPLQNLAKDGELYTYKHPGFWKCMDTLRDKNDLNKLWDSNHASWKLWL